MYYFHNFFEQGGTQHLTLKFASRLPVEEPLIATVQCSGEETKIVY